MNENRPAFGRPGRPRPVLLLVAGCAIAGGALTGCGSSSAAGAVAAGTPGPAMSMPSSSAAAGMAATATTIMIAKSQCAPPPSVSPGASVHVMNMDDEEHTITADTGNAFGVTVPAGTTVTFSAPSSAGSYDFHCDHRASMRGALVVR